MATAVTRFFSLFEPNANVTVVTATATAVAASKFHLFPAIRIQTTLSFRRYSSASASLIADDHTLTTAAAAETAEDSQQHPWPEFVTFVGRLKAKGYMNQEAGNTVTDYKDIRLLKTACLSFGRDRFDLFKSLSMQDVHTLVANGCPDISRKTVNSGKRLRAYLQLDEAYACGACVFRESCRRACVIQKDDVEWGSRTVDIVRILLSYALDAVGDSDKKPFGAEVSTSAKKLLLELTKLSDTRVDPELQKPAGPVARKGELQKLAVPVARKAELQKPAVPVARKAQSFEFKERDSSRNVEMKRGDWLCPKCSFLNFARNKNCRKCDAYGPQKDGNQDVEMKKGNWICPQCNFMNFSKNIRCMKCKTEGPKKVVGTNDIEMKQGDWNCPQCNFMNFSRNILCMKCNTKGPKTVVGRNDIEMKKGDWNCPQCQFMNFASNTKCLRCREHRPETLLNA